MQLAGISVDPPEHNVRMRAKLLLPFPLLSDARGELARLYGLWNAEEGVAVPAIVVVDTSGEIRYLYSGSDFADRPGDKEVFEALDSLRRTGEYGAPEPEVRLTAAEAKESVRPDKTPMALENLVPYYRGVYFATVALKKRFGAWGRSGREALREVGRYQEMVVRYRQALDKTRRLKAEQRS